MMTERISQYVFLDRYARSITANLAYDRTRNDDIGCKFRD